MTRTFIRAPSGSQVTPAEVAAAMREALAADGIVDVLDEVGGASVPVFSVVTHPHGPAVVARTPDGRPLAVCADPLVAVRSAFAALDHAAEQRRSTRPRPSRARGRTTKELCR